MGTRSFITIKHKDNTYSGVYCHWDGYVEHNGKILKEDYQARSKVVDLIDGGDMSCCWTDNRWDDSGVMGVYGPQYYSQRGEHCDPRLDANKYDYLAEGEEYAYLYTLNGEWVCYDRHQFEENTMPTVAEIPSGALAV